MTQRLSLFLCPTSRVTERLEDVQKQVHSIKLEEKYEEMRIDTGMSLLILIIKSEPTRP